MGADYNSIADSAGGGWVFFLAGVLLAPDNAGATLSTGELVLLASVAIFIEWPSRTGLGWLLWEAGLPLFFCVFFSHRACAVHFIFQPVPIVSERIWLGF